MEIKSFTKSEFIGVIVIFLVLIGVSAPNFYLSIKRARDQVRRDDMAAIQGAMNEYLHDFGYLPSGTKDGKILACKDPNEKVRVDSKGRLIVNLLPCEWGKDSIVDLTPGSSKVYLAKLPQDPDFQKGVSYIFFSDGSRYQIFTSFEVKSQAEYDPKIVARNIMCGTRLCNVGRNYGCPTEKTIEQCQMESGK